ncbi:hypothetical protein [Actinomadura meridiana]|uniref:hypothetical protein n=1 Tax=Actinomadura meridiana TaxID=559626 RepID=UPI0031E82EF1
MSNDHAGTLWPAAVPAAAVFLRVIKERPGEPRDYALAALLDWWGCFKPEAEHPTYLDPVTGPVEVTEGIMRQVREAAPALRRLVDDSATASRKGIAELLRCLDSGWTTEDD